MRLRVFWEQIRAFFGGSRNPARFFIARCFVGGLGLGLCLPLAFPAAVAADAKCEGCSAAAGTMIARASTETLPLVKLKPRMRVEVPGMRSVSLRTLRPDLEESVIFPHKQQFLFSPFVSAEDHHYQFAGNCNLIFVRGLRMEGTRYKIFRPGLCYVHPCTGEFLGFEAVNVGQARMQVYGDPAQLQVLVASESIEAKHRVFPACISGLPDVLIPKPAEVCNPGFLLSVRDEYVGGIGPRQAVMISLGERDGLSVGDVLNIHRNDRIPAKGKTLEKTQCCGWDNCCKIMCTQDHVGEDPCPVPLPSQNIGCVIIYQTSEKLSLGIVLEAKSEIKLLDVVRRP